MLVVAYPNNQETLQDLRDTIARIEQNSDLPSTKKKDPQNLCCRVELGSKSSAIVAKEQESLVYKPPSSPGFDAQTAFNKIVRLVSRRDYASSELRCRLAHVGYHAEIIDEALERACACGLVDDRRFAATYCRSKMSQGKGIAGIKQILKDLGIDPEVIEAWSDEYGGDEETEKERAFAVLNQRPPRSKNLYEGAYRKLISKGFAPSIAYSAARRWVYELHIKDIELS